PAEAIYFSQWRKPLEHRYKCGLIRYACLSQNTSGKGSLLMTAPNGTSARLKWNGPYSFRELLSNAGHRVTFNSPGVYLWINQVRQPERISYVGKASGEPDLWTRQWQHYIAYIAGHYQLPAGAGPDGTAWE